DGCWLGHWCTSHSGGHSAGCSQGAVDLFGGEQSQGGEVLDGLRCPSQQVPAVGGLTHGVVLRDDDPRRGPRDDELGGEGQIGGAERVGRVVGGDDVERRGEQAGAGAELVARGDADVHGDGAVEGVAEVEDAGDLAAVREQVVAVEV